MPDRTITALSYSVGILFAAYIALVGATVYFAALQTDYSASVRDLESEVAALETKYYAALSSLSDAEATLAGYVVPVSVDYVAKGGEPALTRADR